MQIQMAECILPEVSSKTWSQHGIFKMAECKPSWVHASIFRFACCLKKTLSLFQCMQNNYNKALKISIKTQKHTAGHHHQHTPETAFGSRNNFSWWQKLWWKWKRVQENGCFGRKDPTPHLTAKSNARAEGGQIRFGWGEGSAVAATANPKPLTRPDPVAQKVTCE